MKVIQLQMKKEKTEKIYVGKQKKDNTLIINQ